MTSQPQCIDIPLLPARQMSWIRLCILPLLAIMAALASAAPEPDPVPRRWQLDVRMGPLRVATVEAPEVGRKVYVYLTYLVTNNSGEDRLFAPSFELATDEGHLIRSGQGVPLEVTREIQRRLDNPLLEDQIKILGPLLQGEANAKDGLVIWPLPSVEVDEINIYAAGFSGETRTVEFTMPDGEVHRITLRKTLMLRHSTPGIIAPGPAGELERVEQRWIMR